MSTLHNPYAEWPEGPTNDVAELPYPTEEKSLRVYTIDQHLLERYQDAPSPGTSRLKRLSEPPIKRGYRASGANRDRPEYSLSLIALGRKANDVQRIT